MSLLRNCVTQKWEKESIYLKFIRHVSIVSPVSFHPTKISHRFKEQRNSCSKRAKTKGRGKGLITKDIFQTKRAQERVSARPSRPNTPPGLIRSAVNWRLLTNATPFLGLFVTSTLLHPLLPPRRPFAAAPSSVIAALQLQPRNLQTRKILCGWLDPTGGFLRFGRLNMNKLKCNFAVPSLFLSPSLVPPVGISPFLFFSPFLRGETRIQKLVTLVIHSTKVGVWDGTIIKRRENDARRSSSSRVEEGGSCSTDRRVF